MTETEHANVELLVAWLDAMSRRDVAAIERLFDPDVVRRGVPEDAICRNRAEVIDMLRGQLDAGVPSTRALELVAGPDTVVLGVRSPQLREIGSVPLPGQLFNVFEVRDGRIVAGADYATRSQACRPPARSSLAGSNASSGLRVRGGEPSQRARTIRSHRRTRSPRSMRAPRSFVAA